MVKPDPIYEKCPADNSPNFKTCHHCESCAVLKAWRLERSKPSLSEKISDYINSAIAFGIMNVIFISCAIADKKDKK